MKVSVVIPCWNAEAYLAQALGSVLEQTHPVHEVVVVDDGSTDASLEVAQRFSASDPELVRVFSQRSGNAALTRNLGAQVATGDALLFLDADDVLGLDAVAGLVEALGSAPGGVAICPWFRLELADGTWVERPPSCAPRRPGQSALSAWLVGWYHPPCSVLWSRDAFERVGRFDELSTNDDGDLMMRALAGGVPLVEATRGAGYYRRLPQGEISFSATRLTRRGLVSRIRTVVKIVAWLEHRQQLDAHRDAVSTALGMLADDAGTRHPDLRRSAEHLAWRYAPPRGRLEHALRRAARTGPGAQPMRSAVVALRRARSGVPAQAAAPAAAHEVRFGLTAADEVMGSSPPAAPKPVPQIRRPVVSVVIPTYNRARVLRRTLEGVLAQTVRDIEVLVVDDGSTDGTAELVAGWSDPRVRYLRQPRNAGVGAARNRGMREARGEFIALLDDDDEWLPTKLARQLECFAGLPGNVGLVYTGVEDHDGAGGVVVRTPTHRGRIYRDMLVTNVLHGAPSSALMRRCVVATAGFFDEDLVAIEDYDYWLRITRFFAVDFVAEPLVRYHDPQDVVRRSVDTIANREARAAFYSRYEAEMRRAGVRHLFLVRSSWRHLDSDPLDRRGARRLALRAVRVAPLALPPHVALARSVAPGWVSRLRRDAAGVPARRTDATPDGLVVMLYSAQPRLVMGGVQDVCARLSTRLSERGHTVVAAGPDVEQAAPPPVATLDLVRPLSRRWRVVPRVLSTARSLLAVYRALRRWRPDIVNVHFIEGQAAYFLLLRPLFGFSVVLSAHGSDVLLIGGGSRALPRLLPRADAITAVSGPVAARVSAFPGVDTDRLHLITNGVDLDFWTGPPTTPRAEAEGRGCTVVAVGRLHPVKGHDVLLEALPLVREHIGTVRLVLIGAGEEEEALREQVRESGLDDAVVFTGHLPPEEVREQMRDADVFVLPSRSEGMPLSLLEAMATGLASVATSVGGVPDVLVPGTGLLVPPEDPAALAEALTLVLSDRDLRDRLASRAQARARRFSATTMYDAYEHLFSELARRAAGGLALRARLSPGGATRATRTRRSPGAPAGRSSRASAGCE